MESTQNQVTSGILDAVKAGDKVVSKQFVEMLYPQVVSIVRGHLPRSESEEDLCQEIFLKVFGKIEQFSGMVPFEHWVSRIALNTCLDRLRRQKRSRVSSFAEMGYDEDEFFERTQINDEAGPSDHHPDTSGKLAVDTLEKLFTALKPREQMVIRLLDLEEKSVADVQELTGWSAENVRVIAMRSRRKLGLALKELEKIKITNH